MTMRTASGCVALVLSVVGTSGCSSDPLQGDCGIGHRYDGERYDPTVQLPRQPRGGAVIGEADRIACGQTIGHDDVHEIAGVSSRVAVVIDGYVMTRRGAEVPGPLLRAAQRPIRCTGRTSLLATWRGSLQPTLNEMPASQDDGSSARPFRLEVESSAGDLPALERWQRLQLTVLVTAETTFSPDDERKASYDVVPMRISTHCDGDEFVADQIELEPASASVS